MHDYLIALGSNMPSAEHGTPAANIGAAFAMLRDIGPVIASPIVASAPLGPSRRRYANAAALLESDLSPPELLALLKHIERGFGRRAGGRRWGARVLDLDIVLWRGGAWASPSLTIPHPAFRQRGFVLGPASAIAPRWRDPISGLSVRQLNARLTAPRRLPSAPPWSGR